MTHPLRKRSPGGFQELGDWRGATLARVRLLIHDAIPDIEEEWKWRGNARLVLGRHYLHRGNLQAGGQTHFCPRRVD